MKVAVKQWGNSAAVRIPAPVMRSLGLALDQLVEVRAENGRIVIERVEPAEPALADLVAGITPENLHGEVPAGPARGREVW